MCRQVDCNRNVCIPSILRSLLLWCVRISNTCCLLLHICLSIAATSFVTHVHHVLCAEACEQWIAQRRFGKLLQCLMMLSCPHSLVMVPICPAIRHVRPQQAIPSECSQSNPHVVVAVVTFGQWGSHRCNKKATVGHKLEHGKLAGKHHHPTRRSSRHTTPAAAKLKSRKEGTQKLHRYPKPWHVNMV
jgi:hypothetical protein